MINVGAIIVNGAGGFQCSMPKCDGVPHVTSHLDFLTVI